MSVSIVVFRRIMGNGEILNPRLGWMRIRLRPYGHKINGKGFSRSNGSLSEMSPLRESLHGPNLGGW